MSVEKDTKDKMNKAIEVLKDEYRNLRTGRPNPGMLDPVLVEVYGSEMKIRDLATVSVQEPRQLVITPYDASTAGPIAKGIEKANLNLQAIVEGNMIRVPVPALNEEMRKEISKQAKKRAEDAKIQIRDIRRKGNDLVKKMKADGDITEDVMKRDEKKIQELTDQYCKEIDTIFKEKETDILSV